MKKIINDLWDRVNNVGTFVAVLSLIALLANQFVDVNLEWVNATINIVASIGVALGVLNNPSGNFKPYIPGITEPKEINPQGEVTEFRK